MLRNHDEDFPRHGGYLVADPARVLAELRIRRIGLLRRVSRRLRRIGRLAVDLRLRRLMAGGRWPRQLCRRMVLRRLPGLRIVVTRLPTETRPSELRFGGLVAAGGIGPRQAMIDGLAWARGAAMGGARAILIVRSCHDALIPRLGRCLRAAPAARRRQPSNTARHLARPELPT